MTKYLKFRPIVNENENHFSIVDHSEGESRYKYLAKECGGDFIEYCNLMVGKMQLAAICDDEGKCKATIPPASTVFKNPEKDDGELYVHTVGDILFTMMPDDEGNDVDITEDAVKAVMRNARVCRRPDGTEHVVVLIHFNWSEAEEVA